MHTAKLVDQESTQIETGNDPSILIRADAQRAATKDAPLPPLPRSFGCVYCISTFYSDEQREVHVSAEHVADIHDNSEEANAKPLVRMGRLLFENGRS